ncbi:MAG TPA: ribonuclease HII [Xanthomonadales bacterium]|nr:ribonuclease HII [Xanthomonadales bacterium]
MTSTTSTKDLVAGVDEAGRGPLAGPVVVAAVILDPQRNIDGLDDSKRLPARQREHLFEQIQRKALAWSIVHIGVADIDRLNILQATLWGMQQAVAELQLPPHRVLVDGNRAPALGCEVQAIVQGDRLEAAISAASILAKVSRDRFMLRLHESYPQYSFDRHKGYPTALHLRLLELHGPCHEHRASFAPVQRLLQAGLFSQS